MSILVDKCVDFQGENEGKFGLIYIFSTKFNFLSYNDSKGSPVPFLKSVK